MSHSGLQPAWKEEVNRRIEAHKHRKGISVVDESDPSEQQPEPGSRAAAAAARVAARYAKAPSFSDMQAAEARVALRAAEATTRAALEAQAAAQAVLDHFENKPEPEHIVQERQPVVAQASVPARQIQHSEPAVQSSAAHSKGIEVRWEPDMPVRPAHQEMRAETRDSWNAQPKFDAPVYEPVEAAEPIPANLIEFPREIIAPRRMRPRISEASPETEDPQQLSIFEVDPNMVSTEPMASATMADVEPTWIGTSWQQIELDAEPQQRPLPDYYAIPAADAPKLYQAPFGRRMMATMVDTALILALFLGVTFLVASKFDQLPGKHLSEVLAALAMFGLAALYEWFFLTFAKVTPGMRYAQLSLCTFDEQTPAPAEIKGRLKAMLISVLPLGLGMLWSIFDEDQMSWHDRLSKTYLRLS
ncbi:MAG TPA: RDD family protein [Terracidiphilus sp.]